MEGWGEEVAGGAAELRDRDAAKYLAITATVSFQFTLAQHENDALEIGVTSHCELAGDYEKTRSARERGIAIDERELRSV